MSTLTVTDETGRKILLTGRAADVVVAMAAQQEDVNRFECGSLEVHFKHDGLSLDVIGRRVYFKAK